MRKIILIALLLALGLGFGPRARELGAGSAPAGLPLGAAGSLSITPEMFRAFKAAPKAAARTVFENGAKAFNKYIDKQYAQAPAEQRPYITAHRLAELADSVVRSYRSGNTALAEELAGRIPIEVSVEEKIDFLEQIAKIYLDGAAKK